MTAYSRRLGDPTHKPNPNLAPLLKPHFYAVRIHAGLACTSLGLEADADGRVLDVSGMLIPVLYTAGIDMNSPFKGAYLGADANLGPSITFGYRAA